MCALPISRRRGDPEPHEAEAAFEEIWRARGPADHAFAADYRKLASRLIAALLNAGAGHRFRDAQPLAINFPNGRVLVEPNELAERSEEHTSELPSLMRISYAVFCLTTKN